MVKRKFSYVLKGEPYSLIRYENSKPPPGDSPAKFDQILFVIDLEKQHEGIAIMRGPVHLDATFYFSMKKRYQGKKIAFGINSISRFVHGLEMLCVGRLIESSVMVSSCTAKRFYAKKPSIKFSITEL